MYQNTRTYGRINPEKRINCLISGLGTTHPLVAEVRDIGPGGIGLLTDMEISEGAFLEVRVNFTTFNLDDTPAVKGKVVHCHKDKDTEKYVIGVSYTRRPSEG